MIRNAISQIIQGKNLYHILRETLDSIYTEGPVHVSDMEILSYFATYKNDLLAEHIDKILLYMGMYYKVRDVQPQTMKELVQTLYRDEIIDSFGSCYTPVQTNIINGIESNKYFSFSAPTSTGKSHVFRDLILKSSKDIVIFVPSRALINEYYLTLCKSIPNKEINILTFVDKLNTANAKRSIFILTPERSSELFSRSQEFDVDYFLFDEAQLGEEVSMRGLVFDSVVRRISKFYPNAKLVFAQPFVANPEVQFSKNFIPAEISKGISFRQKNVGQIFYSLNKKTGVFFHVGIDRKVMGNKFEIGYDPIELTLMYGGTVLFYVSKSNIVKYKVFEDYKKYIDLCGDIESEKIKEYQERIKEYTGASADLNRLYYSASLDLLKKGVVVHHGSMPLKMRSIIEDFINAGLCRICFATSTIEQGINMPFDTIFIGRFEASKPLAVKNLIGRAGRSTSLKKFDVGKVVISTSNETDFRKIMSGDYSMRESSLIEHPSDELGPDFDDFRQSIIDGSYVEEYNMTPKQLNLLSSEEIQKKITDIVPTLFDRNNAVRNIYDLDEQVKNPILSLLISIYETHLGRKVTRAESNVLQTALYILFCRMFFKSFSSICKIRYNTLCRTKEQRILQNAGKDPKRLKVKYIVGYSDIPNLNLGTFPLVDTNYLAKDIDFDVVVYDTYDFLDKLIGFKLTDIYYAAFKLNYDKNSDVRSLLFANLVKYGTSDEREILMVRYGLSLDDIKILGEYIVNIDTTGISVKPEFYNLSTEQRRPLERFV